MGRGYGSALLTRASEDGSAEATDHRLVAAVRRGDDRAFELLYQRYHRRIHAYVLGMVKDHGRAEDVTQEVFVSALRRMRATERPIAFKPWVYEIAKNACIDAFRRSKRAEEVSFDAEDSLAPGDHARLAANGPTPDMAVAVKHDLESLWGAFGGLSETHHEILVLRELEGLTYAEIGRRMGMSRAAVESTLFRARRRLTEEYDDIVSGARCLRIQSIIQIAARSRLGARDTRRLARHLAHCQPCRREAMDAGLDRGLIARPPVRERVATRVAGLLPFPIFARWRHGGSTAASASSPGGGRGAGLVSHLPLVSDHLTDGWGRLVAGGALLVAGVGAGVGVHDAATARHHAAAHVRPALTAHHAAARTPASAPRTRDAADRVAAPSVSRRAAKASRKHRTAAAHVRRVGASPARRTTAPSSTAAARPAAAGGGTSGPANPVATAVATAGPAATAQPVTDTVKHAVGTVNTAVQQTTTTVDTAVQQAAGGTPAGQVAGDATNAVTQTTDAVTGALTGH